ncbi:MAG: M3 family metallopeptidase [Candidatus Krumholzibacteriia bacterium]
MIRTCLLTLTVFLLAGSSSLADTENPLLAPYGTAFDVPPFDRILPAHFEPAFEAGMEQERAEVAAIAGDPEPPSFENTIAALDRAGELLRSVQSVFYGLTGANTGEELQQVNQRVSPRLAAHRDEMRLDERVFARIATLHDAREELDLDAEQRFLLEKMYRDGVRNGALLDPPRQARLKEINQALSALRVRFGDNLLAETNGFLLVIEDRDDLAGLPEPVVAAAARAAREAGHDGAWVFTTHKPSMLPFLTYAHDRELRQQLFTAYIMRGNNANEHDNTGIMAEVLKLRVERAALLGYDTYADYVLETRMAGTPERVYELLDRLWEAALPVARREVDEMQQIIDREGGDFRLAAWDWWYYAEKLRKEKYDLDDNELRPYFQLEQVRDGMFWVANQLYGLTFQPLDDLPLPHPEAEAFQVREADGSHCAVIYLDYHPRASKRQGAWCGAYRQQNRARGHEVDPIVNLVCNFTRPSGDTPALLSLDEVETLFHEFGHGLDVMLSDVTFNTLYRSADFSELPSQIMEHWALEPTVLAQYARHHRTGEVIPDQLVAKIKAGKHFNQGFATVEYLAASLLDMKFHTLTAADDLDGLDVMALEKSYLDEIGLIPEIAPRYRASYFGHIIGGYAAGYYGYIWSGVLDNDAFEAFQETSLFDQATAQRFREAVLERNGTADFMQMYLDFRGREPRIEPLLRQRGLM